MVTFSLEQFFSFSSYLDSTPRKRQNMGSTALIGAFIIALIVIGNRHFGWSHRFQEWRYGRKIDETVDWQNFTDAFKVEK